MAVCRVRRSWSFCLQQSGAFFFGFFHSGTKWCKYGHTGIWTQDLPHAMRMWCHCTMCPYRHCLPSHECRSLHDDELSATSAELQPVEGSQKFGSWMACAAGLVISRCRRSGWAWNGEQDCETWSHNLWIRSPTPCPGTWIACFSHALKQMVHNMWPEYRKGQ